MGLKIHKPITPGRRHMVTVDFAEITKKKPEKKLVVSLKKAAGRSRGKITVRHKGGGAKKLYRMVDFNQFLKIGQEAKVLAIEYDPYRTARIALIQYQDGEKSYILAPLGLKVGDVVKCAEKTEIRVGNRAKLANIPVGTSIYNIEIVPRGGGRLVRSAGVSASLIGKEDDYCLVKLPSGEIRKIHQNCFASIGVLSVPEHAAQKIGKAGRSRWMGIRPTTRGKAMNPVDHPHGGGEGRTDIGLVHPKTPWGAPALGYKTRKHKKYSEKFIIKRKREAD
jgi:large subunit ribosomal protein L2